MTKRISLSILADAAGDLPAIVRAAMPLAEIHTDGRLEADLIIADGQAIPARVSGTTLRLSPTSGSDEGALSREAFVRDPAGCIALALSASRTTQRQPVSESEEVEFARHIRELMSVGNVDEVFRKVSERALEHSGATWATLLLHDPVSERFAVAYSNDPEQPEGAEFLPGIAPELLQRAVKSPEGFAVRDTSNKRGGMAVVPLLVGDDLIGVFSLGRPRGEEMDLDTTRGAAHYIHSVAPLLITVHQLSKSKDLALRDDLTKAFNRRFFDAHLDEEIERARRYNSLVSVIFLDLDDLKLVNNRYGHLTGSRMLQEVARRILGAVRGIDKVVRFGGDEFCIILPQTDPDQARAVATRIRKAMSERKFSLEPDIELAMTASFGIATYPVHAMTKEDLIRAADAAMYRVKSSSKNAIAEALRPEEPHAVDAETAG